jgi:tRNA A-37 threonylcarbamoyl transferase component Bud32
MDKIKAIPKYYHIKENVLAREYRIYKYLHNMELKFIPKLYDYDKTNKKLKTQKINGLSISDFYGDKFEDIPERIIDNIRYIINYLYNIGIIYPDITGYNFIEDSNSNIWIVDFEHCFYINHYSKDNDNLTEIKYKDEHIDFVNRFCFKNEQGWNPYFA